MQDKSPAQYAAIDLGSNSFHLLIAREIQGELQTLDRLGDKVQLAAGLDERRCLSDAARQRGLECLERFAQRLAGLPRENIRVVGTNTLRAARNRTAFIEAAEALLQCPVEVISGREEARLIYLGVAHSFADDQERRLVIDIGGGSTEFIIGERFSPLQLESLHMGCVSYTQRFFDGGKISAKRFQQAVKAAHLELLNIRSHYRRLGWSDAVGSSGTIKAIQRLVNRYGDGEINLANLNTLRKALLKFETVAAVAFEEVKPTRAAVLPGGLAILIAVFESLELAEISYSDGALREGVLYDQLGRLTHEDVRERTISALMERYYVDADHARAVERTALACLAQTPFDGEEQRHLLSWAARLHELGLAISHSQFQKHGAYLVLNTDLMGFNQSEQQRLAHLVRHHRRKLDFGELESLRPKERKAHQATCLLLRLAVLLHHSRSAEPLPEFGLEMTNGGALTLRFPEGWLEGHPLTQADLEAEQAYQAAAGGRLEIR